MAGLNHDFLLLSKKEHPYADYCKWINSPEAILIHDDLIRYLNDTVQWVTCYNPGNRMRKMNGLNPYGPSIIKTEGAVVFEKLLSAWAKIFSCGPGHIQLGTPFVLEFNRDQLVKDFHTLAKWARSVSRSGDDLYILHLGI